MKNVNISLITTNGGDEMYTSNFIYTVDDSILSEKIKSTIEDAKKEIYEYDNIDIMDYLVEKLGGRYKCHPMYSADINIKI